MFRTTENTENFNSFFQSTEDEYRYHANFFHILEFPNIKCTQKIKIQTRLDFGVI